VAGQGCLQRLQFSPPSSTGMPTVAAVIGENAQRQEVGRFFNKDRIAGLGEQVQIRSRLRKRRW